MSVTWIHPLPWAVKICPIHREVIDANGNAVSEHDSVELAAELAATRTEWFRSNTELAAALAENARLREQRAKLFSMLLDEARITPDELEAELSSLRAKEGE